MVIYQILDEQNYPVGEYLDIVVATQNAEDLAYWQDSHHYHVEKLSAEEEEDLSWVGAA
jgi:hypothetical protein